MKRIGILAVLMVMVVAGIALGAGVVQGFGKKLTATTTPQVQRIGASGGDYCNYLRITNTGTEDIRLMLNTETAGFVATNALVVSPGFPETFYNGDKIYSFCYSAESSTSTFTANATARP